MVARVFGFQCSFPNVFNQDLFRGGAGRRRGNEPQTETGTSILAARLKPESHGGGWLGGERVPKQAHAHLGALSNCPHIIKLFLRKNQTSSSQIFSRAVRSPSRACWQANPCNCLSSPLSSCFEDGLLLPTNRRRLAIIPSQSSSSIRRRKLLASTEDHAFH